MRTGSLSASTRLSPQRARLVMAIGCVLIAVGLALLLLRVYTIMLFFSDFTHDYVSAQAFLDGRSIYVEFTQADLSAEKLRIAEQLYRPEPFTNIHPPFDVLLFAPLALLPYDLAALAWSLLSCGLYLWIGRTVLRELGITFARHWQALLLGLGLCWYPFQAHIALGQISLLVVACLVGCWALLRRNPDGGRGGRDGWAGVLLGLACLIKMYPGVLLLYLLVRRRWYALAATCATGALGLAITFLLVGPADVVRYFTQVVAEAAGFNTFSLVNISLSGAFGRVLTDGPWIVPLIAAPQLSAALTLLSEIGLLALLVYRLWRAPATQAEDDRGFALVVLLMLLVSPITWQHVLPVLLLPFGLVLLDLRAGPVRARIGLALLAAVLVSLPDVDIARGLMALYAPYRTSWFAALAMLGPTIGLLLLWRLLWTQRYEERNDAGLR